MDTQMNQALYGWVAGWLRRAAEWVGWRIRVCYWGGLGEQAMCRAGGHMGGACAQAAPGWGGYCGWDG